MDIVDRLFELVDEKFKEQKDFAFALGVPAPRVSEWRKRKSASFSKKELLPKIAEILGTTSEYLLTGEGPKNKTASTNVPDSGTPDFMVKFRQLSPNAQKEVLAFIEFKRGQEDNNAGI